MDSSNIKSVDYKISTMTMSCKIPNCQLNLLNIGKYLEIDHEVIGIKYSHANLNVMKGQYCTTIYKKSKNKVIEKINKTLFYNQISVIVKANSHDINVKLFGNGSLHLTGCRSKNDAVKVSKCIYQKLKQLQNMYTEIILSKDTNNILLDKDNLIYSYSDFQIIGYKDTKINNQNIYNINKKEYIIDENTKMFISIKEEIQRKRILLNLDGKQIGYAKIELLKNHNKLYRKNGNLYYDWKNKLIFHNESNIIGRIVYEMDEKMISDVDRFDDVFEIKYIINPFSDTYNDYILNTNLIDSEYEKTIDINIHCINICLSLQSKINRQKFYENLVNLNFICKYRPESYSGIKLIYKIQDFQNESHSNEIISKNFISSKYDGKCYCTCKCICTNITFLIFQSGNIIVTGFKNTDQIDEILLSFLNIWKSFSDSVSCN